MKGRQPKSVCRPFVCHKFHGMISSLGATIGLQGGELMKQKQQKPTQSTHMEKIENKIDHFQYEIAQPLDTSRKR